MFNLFRSREKTVRYLLGAVLMLVAFMLVVTLIPGYGTPSNPETLVAEVGGEKIGILEVQRAIQIATRSRQVPPEILQNYIPQIIEQLVTERAMAFEASRRGFTVSDSELADAVRITIPQLFTDGKFAGTDVYASMLAQQNLTITEFEQGLRRTVLYNRLRSVALEGTIVSPLEVESEFRKRNEKAKFDYVKLPLEKFRSQIKPPVEEAMAEYKRTPASYMMAEQRAFNLVVLDPLKVEESVNVTDADLQSFYSAQRERFRTPERVRVRHILVKTDPNNKASEGPAKTKAEGILKQIKGGADFAELAKKNSDDPGSGSRGGDLDWVTRGQTVKNFEDTAFSLKPNEMSNLVQTEYGFHIIQVLEKQTAGMRPFDEVKTQIADEAKKQRANQMVVAMSEALQSGVGGSAAKLEQVAAQMKLPVLRVAKAGPTDPLPEIGVSADLSQALFSLKKGEATNAVSASANRLVIGAVTEIFPRRQASFDEVKDQIMQPLVDVKLRELLRVKAKEFSEKLTANGGDLKKTAQAFGLEVRSSGEFPRGGVVEGLGSAGQFIDAFTKPAGTAFGPLQISDGWVVGKFAGQTPADMSQFAMQSQPMREEIKSRKARERNTLFEDGLRQTLTKEGKIKIYQESVRRLMANYRG